MIEWITGDTDPECGRALIVTIRDGNKSEIRCPVVYHQDWFTQQYYFFNGVEPLRYVTAWMYMPEPYKKGNTKE